MFFSKHKPHASRRNWPWPSNLSEWGTKHIFCVNLSQIRSAVPEIFHTQTKQVTDSTKNRTLCSSLHLVISYPNSPSSWRSVPHDNNLPVQAPKNFMYVSQMTTTESRAKDDVRNTENYVSHKAELPEIFSQAELNNIIPRLDLPKTLRSVWIMFERQDLVACNTSFWGYRVHKEFTCYFSKLESLVFCKDIPG